MATKQAERNLKKYLLSQWLHCIHFWNNNNPFFFFITLWQKTDSMAADKVLHSGWTDLKNENIFPKVMLESSTTNSWILVNPERREILLGN